MKKDSQFYLQHLLSTDLDPEENQDDPEQITTYSRLDLHQDPYQTTF
jgi:hypothetical protein